MNTQLKLNESDINLIGEALILLMIKKRDAYAESLEAGLPFGAVDFGIPQIQSMLEQIENLDS